MSEPDSAPPAYDTLSIHSPDLVLEDAQASSDTAHDALPIYVPPSQFKIGSVATVAPLVSIPEVKGHLALLHSFADLKNQIEAIQHLPDHLPPLSMERRWAWFVGLAVERFDLWCRNLTLADASKAMDVVIPPLDVLMVWHSYMLNPRWYAEDCMRIDACKILKAFEGHFFHLLSNPSLTIPPSNARNNFWQSKTEMAFDLLECCHTMICKLIQCPKCNALIQVEYMNAEGTGYLQQQFATHCPNPACDISRITKGTLGLRKLAESLAIQELGSHLAGTWFAGSLADKQRETFLKKKILELSQSFSLNPLSSYIPGSSEYQEALSRAIMERFKFSISDLREKMSFLIQRDLVGRIMAAHSDDKIYSVELLGAVLRQGSFVSKMDGLHWSRPGFFDTKEDEMALQHALARYHAFLDLMSSSAPASFVPTLDIDLVWHTHQLKPQQYKSDCIQYLKRFIDHDDKVEGLRLSTAFNATCRAWRDRFNVEYIHCGCVVPGETIGQRLSHLVGRRNHSSPSLHLLPPYDRPDVLAVTHPSDHNAVRFARINQEMHTRANMEYRRLAAWKKYERKHNPAFLVPVPIFFPEGRIGSERLESVTCVSTDGKFVISAAGCSNFCQAPE